MSAYLDELYQSLKSDEERSFISQFVGAADNRHMREYASERLNALAEAATHTENWPFEYKPHDHQKEIFRSTAAHVADSSKPNTGYTVVPTGGGKTFVFTHIINAMAQTFKGAGEVEGHKTAPPTVILVPSEDLVGQTVEEFQSAFPDLEVGQYYGKQKQIRPVTVMVYNSFVDAVDKGWIQPGDLSMLVMDEAHRGLSDMRQDIFDRFKENTQMLAYTATPDFDEDKNIESMFGANSHIYTTTTRQLINDKKLTPVDNYVLRVNMSFAPGAEPENDREMRQLMRIAKMKAAAEFLLDYEDPETGEMLLGDTTLGFVSPTQQNNDQSYVQQATAYFDETIRERASNDPFIASRIAPYGKMAEPMGSAVGDSKDVLARLKNGATMAAFSVRYGREGSDIRRATNLLNIHGSSSKVDARQAGGRVLRKWDEGNPNKRAKIVDCVATINGERTPLDNPVFYFEAIGDESVLKTVLDTDMRLDEATKKAWLQEAEELEAKTPPKPRRKRATGDEHFLGKKKLFDAVLGEGDAKLKYRSVLTHVYGKIEQHYTRQLQQREAVPYVVAGQALDVRAASAVAGKKVEFAVNEDAIDALRTAIRFPKEKSAAFLDKEECRTALFGRSKASQDYAQAFDAFWDAYVQHYEDNKFRVEQGTHLRHLRPFSYNNHEMACSECLDEQGNLMPVVSVHSITALREMLGAPKAHGPSWCNKQQFMQMMLGGVEQAEMYRTDVEALWQEIEAFADRHPDEYRTRQFHRNGQAFAISRTLSYEGDLQLSVTRAAIPMIRKMLDVPEPEWSAVGSIDQGTRSFYTASVTRKEQIESLRYQDGIIPEKTPEWLHISELADVLGVTKTNRHLVQAMDALKEIHEATPAGEEIRIDGREVRCGFRKASRNAAFCIYHEDVDWVKTKMEALQAAETKTDDWLNHVDVKEELDKLKADEEVDGLSSVATKFMSYAKQKAEKGEACMLGGKALDTTFKTYDSGHKMFVIHRDSFELLKQELLSQSETRDEYIFADPKRRMNEIRNYISEMHPEWSGTERLLVLEALKDTLFGLQDAYNRSLWQDDVQQGIKVAISERNFAVHKDSLPAFVELARSKAAQQLNFHYDERTGGSYNPYKFTRKDEDVQTLVSGRTETFDDIEGTRTFGWDEGVLNLRFEEIEQRLANKQFAKPKLFDRVATDDGGILSTWENGKTRLVKPDGSETEGVDETIRTRYTKALEASKDREPSSDREMTHAARARFRPDIDTSTCVGA